MMDHDQQPGSIASHVAKTLDSFRNFQGALSKAAWSDDALEGASLNDFRLQTENDFTRFKMWVGNQAAHQSAPSSLDYRLREAPHLQQQVTYLLKDICESLQTATSLIDDGSSFLVQSHNDRNHESFQDNDSHSSSQGSGEDDEFDFSDLDSNNLPSLSLSTILTDITEAVDCLLRLSVAIANPAPHDRSCKLAIEPYEPRDIAHVRNKFPSINCGLATALGVFITCRRQFLEYRLAHHKKFASNKQTDTCYIGLIQEDTLSDDETSQTTSAHHWLFAGTGQATVPPRPSASDGIFECPFCYRWICAKTRTAWERHVFGDLRPYKCIFPSCIDTNTDFNCRRNWQSHIYKYHWRSWSCPFKCQRPFSTAADFSRHIRICHLPTGTKEEIKSIAATGERDTPDHTSRSCPLCQHPVTGLTEYIHHVGYHLEQLALFALLKLEDEDLEDKTGSEKSNCRPEVGADSPQRFSTTPPSAVGAHATPSFGPPGKGKEAAFSDDTMSDIVSSDLLEPNLGKKAVGRDSWSEDIKVEPPIATPDAPADEQETRREGKIQDQEAWPFFDYSPRESATNNESDKKQPTDRPAIIIPDNSRPIPYHPSLSSIIVGSQSTRYDPPGCFRPATLQPPVGYSGYYIPQQHHPVVQAAAVGSIGEVPVSCVYPGCTARPFGRKADLERHIEYTHCTESNQDTYLCDYSGCHREGEPLYRKDIFRRHLEQFHREEISERGASSAMGSPKTTWWRCPHCLARAYVSEHGFECPSCKTESKSEGKRRS